ncbi:hypothetical protein QP185_03125 [Sphingomonas aerolata]|uniref:hypothetical protein n=1 Tax=Sphingomonas aerolata TaxID=185951 RepID=UPI002FE0DE2F
MTTAVFLTIDTEFAWRHHRAGLGGDASATGQVEPAGVGVSYQLAKLGRYGLKACFFVDPMPALTFGIEPVRRMVATILDRGRRFSCISIPPGPPPIAGTAAQITRSSTCPTIRWPNNTR